MANSNRPKEANWTTLFLSLIILSLLGIVVSISTTYIFCFLTKRSYSECNDFFLGQMISYIFLITYGTIKSSSDQLIRK